MFRLLRYFSIASFCALALALAVLLWFSRQATVDNLLNLGQENNAALTRTFANTIWTNYAAFFAKAADWDNAAIRADPILAELDADIRALTLGLAVLKVKIFTLNGNTIYSSDPEQIGDRRPRHPAILRALSGRITSEVIERGTFSAFDGEHVNVTVISSYVPILAGDGSVIGIIEVYTDVTDLIARTKRELLVLAAQLGTVFVLLYIALFFVVRRGDRLLRLQYAELREGRAQAQAQAARLAKEKTERQRAEREVLALREVEVSQRAMRALVANLSHELRTPLNAIIGFAQLIVGRIHGPAAIDRYADYAGDIESSGKHLLGIINTMLDLAKAEAGKMELHESSVDLSAVAAECVHMLQQRARDAAIEMSTRLPANLPLLLVDERMLRQILLNLLSNAIKFTPKAGRVSIAAEEQPDGALRIDVADTGIGIEPEMIPRVMSPFGQVDDELSRRHQGTGLGLPIVKSLTELHGGAFWLESEPGRGTRAILLFPTWRVQRKAA